MKEEKVIKDLTKDMCPETEPAKPVNFEIQTANVNLGKLKTRTFEDRVIYATNNEYGIIELAQSIEKRMESLVCSLNTMRTMFMVLGENAIYMDTNDLMELKAQLRNKKEARDFYRDLLK